MSVPNTQLMAESHALNKDEKGSRELNDQLYELVIKGDEEACKLMIERNMPLVFSKVDAFVKTFPEYEYLRDDLTSEAFVGLTTAVRKMVEDSSRKKNPTGYMSFYIQYSFGLVVNAEQANGAGKTTVRRHAEKGNTLPRQVDIEPERFEQAVTGTGTGIDPMSMPDLVDEITACCETETDQAIVDLRMKGYFDKEIAAQLDIPYTTIYMLRRSIYERFLDRSGMRGEV